MFRRRTRNSTAYTGVSPVGPSAHQPDNHAMAAALTIGENLKQTQPHVYGKPRAQGSLLKRSGSLQNTRTSLVTSRTSMRTNSTTNTKATTNSNITTSTATQGKLTAAPRNGRVANSQLGTLRVVYSVDDSFSESTLEHMGQEADAHYSNRMQLQDLQLHHTPAPAPVKMVKKYIPTPNGIKIVEVPEETIKREIARSNLIRLGPSSRHGLMTRIPRLASFTAPRLRPVAVKRASMMETTKIEENVALEQRAASNDVLAEQRAESEHLRQQIAAEEKLAAELEQQRKEYERLHALRLENERRLREIKAETVNLPTLPPVDTNGSTSPKTETTVLTDNTGQTKSIEKTEKIETNAAVEQTAIQAKEVAAAVPVEEADDSEEDVPIKPLPFAVDELDQRMTMPNFSQSDDSDGMPEVMDPDGDLASITEGVKTAVAHEAILNTKHEDAKSELSPTKPVAQIPQVQVDEKVLTLNNTGEHKDVADVTHDVQSSEYSLEHPLYTLSPIRGPDEFGIEEVDNLDLPAHHPADVPSPRFDPVPEIIDRLTPPPITLGASSIKSITSAESKTVRPIKSALKVSKPKYPVDTSGNPPVSSPAHQAYLSLATAENTRLNSKLLLTQLDQDVQPPKSPVPKRMSQVMRKQPSAPGMASRLLRPRAQSDASQPGGGMSNRSFKTQPQPQPIPLHPTLQPNYQSPSKLKAAELYAKANSRPRLQFQPAQRRLSFNKNPEKELEKNKNGAKPAIAPPPERKHRMTLRERPYSLVVTPEAQPASQPFKSRYAESDDEDSTVFSSRFNDSHDNVKEHVPRAPLVSLRQKEEVMQTPIVSLRQKEEPPVEKPKKKRFLRKLFGKN